MIALKYKVRKRVSDHSNYLMNDEKEIKRIYIQWERDQKICEYENLDQFLQGLQDNSYGEPKDKEDFRKQLAYRIQQWQGLELDNPMDNLEVFQALIYCKLFHAWAMAIDDGYIGSHDLWSNSGSTLV